MKMKYFDRERLRRPWLVASCVQLVSLLTYDLSNDVRKKEKKVEKVVTEFRYLHICSRPGFTNRSGKDPFNKNNKKCLATKH